MCISPKKTPQEFTINRKSQKGILRGLNRFLCNAIQKYDLSRYIIWRKNMSMQIEIFWSVLEGSGMFEMNITTLGSIEGV